MDSFWAASSRMRVCCSTRNTGFLPPSPSSSGRMSLAISLAPVLASSPVALTGLVNRTLDRRKRGGSAKRLLDPNGDLLEEVPDGATWDPQAEIALDRLGGLSVGSAGGQLGSGHPHLRRVAALAQAQGDEERREGSSLLTISDALDPKVDTAHASDEGTRTGAVLDEPRTTIGEFVAAKVLPEGGLRILEERPEGIPPEVVGAVQQIGKLYRSGLL